MRRLLFLASLFLISAITLFSWTLIFPRMELPDLGQLSDFRLLERSGKTITLSDLKGRTWIAGFIFTSCEGPCPMISRQMSSLEKKLAQQMPNVTFVSFSVDPARDTPEVLKDYAKKFDAPEERWWFLTGTQEAMESLVRDSFHLGIDSNASPIIHSTRLALVDSHAVIRGYYDSQDPEAMNALLKDAESL